MLAKALSVHYIVVSYLSKGILAGITRIQISNRTIWKCLCL